MQGDDVVSILRKMNSTLESLKRVLELDARPAIRSEIDKLASTPERRKMWILADGSLRTEEVAKKSGAKLRTVQIFIQECVRSGLVASEKRGYPHRAIDFIPEDWDEVRQLEKARGESEAESIPQPNQEGGS